MDDILAAMGLMLVLEGALYALFPEGMKRAMLQMQALPQQHLRIAGLTAAIIGFVIVAMVRTG